jgi:putative ABC transport system substrate-binding protein
MKKAAAPSILVAMMLLAVAVIAGQQVHKVQRIGFLSPLESPQYFAAFRQGLRELGYTEGQNIVIEYRSAKGMPERFPDLAAELVRLNVDVIVAASGGGALAVKNATSTIPIVIGTTGDPVASGLVASLARPGGNITGLTALGTELTGKRLELLKEAVPKASRIVVLSTPGSTEGGTALKAMEVAAQPLGIELRVQEVRDPGEFEKTFAAITKEHAGAIMVLTGPLLTTHRKRIVEFAAKSRLPAMYGISEFVDAGGLMFYGASLPEMYRRAATYVDKILKGAKPADLPVEQPTKFEFVINLKAAKQIGLTIPPGVLARADKVIK